MASSSKETKRYVGAIDSCFRQNHQNSNPANPECNLGFSASTFNNAM
jgi:hypothetical protein